MSTISPCSNAEEMGFFGVFSLRSECAEVKIEAPDGEYENLIDSSRVTVKDSRIRSDGRPIIFEA